MKIVVATMMIVVTSISIELNRFGNDIVKKGKKRKPSVLYISNAFISAICGGIMSLSFTLITSNFIIVLVMGVLGSFLGKNSFKIVFKIIMNSFDFMKSDEFSDIFDDKDVK